MGERPIRLSRERLYELVWSAPASELAIKYLISDVGLTKLCRRLRVPKPSRGYWATTNPGKRAKRPQLPDVTTGVTTEVALYLRAESARAQRPPRPELVVGVPEALEHPHKLVSHTAAALNRARPGSDGRLTSWGEGLLSITVSPEGKSRALLLMDTLVKALEVRGNRVAVDSEPKRATVVVIADERIEVSLRERLLRTERPPEDKEHSWSSRFDYRPSGRLTFAILGMGGDGVRQSWSDGRRRLEEKLGSIVLGLEDAAEVAREARLKCEENRRRWEEERRRAEEERARQEAEAKRVEELRDQAQLWEEADRIRRYLAAVEQRVREGAGDHRTRDWLAWAKGVADRLDPIGRH